MHILSFQFNLIMVHETIYLKKKKKQLAGANFRFEFLAIQFAKLKSQLFSSPHEQRAIAIMSLWNELMHKFVVEQLRFYQNWTLNISSFGRAKNSTGGSFPPPLQLTCFD